MRIYRVTAIGGPSEIVFADNFDHAANIFASWHLERHREGPEEVTVTIPECPQTEMDMVHLVDALHRNEPGIGKRDVIAGWRIAMPWSDAPARDHEGDE